MLTPREEQVLALIERGLQNKEIAHELHLTEGTAKQYVDHIMRKTGKNRIELAVWSFARRHGLAA